ncbi:MAG: hypothetical protein JXB36_14460 [Gammaproteobacteria bacterium]|nr:hypothetical protein [Gammaproteobacteria bacterium]
MAAARPQHFTPLPSHIDERISMSFWHSLTELPIYDWARQHQFVTAGIEGAHLASSSVFFGSIILLDLRVLGLCRQLIASGLARLTLRVGLIAFVLVVLTGLFMFGIAAPKWLNTPEFGVKMALIALAGINAAIFHVTIWRSVDVWGAEGRPTPRIAQLFALGSIAIWVTVIILGRYLGYAVLLPSRIISDEELEFLMQPGGPLDVF